MTSKTLVTALLTLATASHSLLSQAAPVDLTALGPQDLDRVGRGIARDQAQVTTDQLAAWLVEGRQDFTLIDVRPPEEYTAGHIESAINITVTDLLSEKALRILANEPRPVLYSNTDRHASLAAVVLSLVGLEASSLRGGYRHWVEHQLNPGKAGDSFAEILDYARRAAVANRLNNCAPMPKIAMPRPTALRQPAAIKTALAPPSQSAQPPVVVPRVGGYGMFSLDGNDASNRAPRGGYGMFSLPKADEQPKLQAQAGGGGTAVGHDHPGRRAILEGLGQPAVGLIVEEGC